MKKRAFQKVLQKNQDRIFSYACYFLRNREDAEDVTQEVFVKVWQHWETIDPKRIIPWMMRVTYHQCVDAARKRKALPRQSIHETDSHPVLKADDTNGWSNPERAYEMTEMQQQILSAMDCLPEKTKHMLLLHYYQGMKCKGIGEVLDMQLSAVKVAIHRGRKMLKTELEKNFPESVEAASHVEPMS